MTVAMPLCRPIDSQIKPDVVYRRIYPSDGYFLIIRPFFIPVDLPVIFDWHTKRYAGRIWKNVSPRAELSQTYQEILESDYAQSFMCHLNDTPICQVDIERVIDNELFRQDMILSGDYQIRIVVSPQLRKFKHAFVNVVRLFLEYFFSFREVHRVLTHLDEEYQQANKLLFKAGFDFLERVQRSDHMANLYGCSRDSLNKRSIYLQSDSHGLIK